MPTLILFLITVAISLWAPARVTGLTRSEE